MFFCIGFILANKTEVLYLFNFRISSKVTPVIDFNKNKGGGGSDKDPKKNRNTYREEVTDEVLRGQAKKLKYKEIYDSPHKRRDELMFQKGDRCISYDRSSHKGGFWKMFERGRGRTGTWNKDLTERIGG